VCLAAVMRLVIEKMRDEEALWRRDFAVGGAAKPGQVRVEPFLVASAVNLAAAQRLVRKICRDCREPYAPTADERELFGFDIPETFYRGRGCKNCRNTGYSGRLAIYELFPITAEIRGMVLQGVDADTIRKHAMDTGMGSLQASGLRKVRSGVTTLEEVLAVVADQE